MMLNLKQVNSTVVCRCFLFLALILGFIMVVIVETRHSSGPYIDFNKVEDVYPATAPPSVRPLRLAISSVLSPKESIGYYRQIADYLSRRLEHPVSLIQRQSYAEVGVLLTKGGADIAFFSSGAFAASADQGEIELLAMQERNNVFYYTGYIIVPRHSKAKSLDDLRGKPFAFSDPLSYSGYLCLAHELQKKGFTPENFFSSYMFTYSHDKSLRAVANNVAAGATISSSVYDHTYRRAPELAEAVRIIEVSEKAGTDPVVVRQSLAREQKAILRELFLAMSQDPDMKPILYGLHIDRFISPQPELYSGIRSMLREVRRTP